MAVALPAFLAAGVGFAAAAGDSVGFVSGVVVGAGFATPVAAGFGRGVCRAFGPGLMGRTGSKYWDWASENSAVEGGTDLATRDGLERV